MKTSSNRFQGFLLGKTPSSEQFEEERRVVVELGGVLSLGLLGLKGRNFWLVLVALYGFWLVLESFGALV